MYLMDIYPFGDISMRITDAISQYPAFFEGLKDGDLFTFKIGLGTNFYTIFTTYLASPLSFLYLFFENYQFDLFFVILVLLKVGLIGLNMNILLTYKKEKNKYSLIFSTIYALSGFVSLYYFNYQFLDALYMLPLIMIGIEKLVNENKNLIYFITLTLMIIFHYYTAYMICIFSVIYFFFLLINSNLEKKDKRKRIIKFFITSLFCGLCSSFITIPSFYSLMQGRSSYFNDINYFSFNKDSLSLFYNFTSGSTFLRDLVNTSTPVFITLFIIVLVLFSLFNKNYTRKYKISILIILLIFILSISFNLFYYGWHFFQRPVGLPGRFVFVFNCFFVLIAYKIFIDKKIILTNKSKTIICLIYIVLCFCSLIFKCYDNNLILLSLDRRYIILFIFNILIFCYYMFLINSKKLSILTVFLILLELLINIICSLNMNFAYIEYENIDVLKDQEDVKTFNDVISNSNNMSFIRQEIFGAYNFGMYYGYNGVSYYVSLYNKNLNSFLKYNNLNFLEKVDGHSIIYKPYFLYDSFLGIKNIYSFYNEENKMEKFVNPYIISSLGFVVENDISYINESLDDMVGLYNYLTNDFYNLELDEIVPNETLINIINEDGIYKIENLNQDGKIILRYEIQDNILAYLNLYKGLYFKNLESNFSKESYELIKVFLNDEEVSNIYELQKGDCVKVEILVPKELKLFPEKIEKLKCVKKNKYLSIIEYLNKTTIENISINKFGFTGTVKVLNNDSTLILTIPYDESIEIYANGMKQETIKSLGGIMSVKLDEGIYQIDFKYRIKGLKMGIIISSISLFIFTVLKVLEKKYIRRYNYIDNKEEIYK